MDIGILVPERTEAVAEDRQYLIGFRKDRRVGGLSVYAICCGALVVIGT